MNSVCFCFMELLIPTFIIRFKINLNRSLQLVNTKSNLKFSQITRSSITVRWSAPKRDGGSKITGYVVEKSQGEVYDFVTCGEVTAEVRSHAITDLNDDTRYDVRVSAVNLEGRGQPSDVLASVLTGNYTC